MRPEKVAVSIVYAYLIVAFTVSILLVWSSIAKGDTICQTGYGWGGQSFVCQDNSTSQSTPTYDRFLNRYHNFSCFKARQSAENGAKTDCWYDHQAYEAGPFTECGDIFGDKVVVGHYYNCVAEAPQGWEVSGYGENCIRRNAINQAAAVAEYKCGGRLEWDVSDLSLGGLCRTDCNTAENYEPDCGWGNHMNWYDQITLTATCYRD